MIRPDSSSFAIENMQAITPSDTVPQTITPRAIKCDVSCNINIVTIGGKSTISYFVAGVWHPVRPVNILATSTTATGIVYGW